MKLSNSKSSLAVWVTTSNLCTLLVFAVGIACTFSYWKYSTTQTIDSATELTTADYEISLEQSRTEIEHIFDRVYDTIRLIASKSEHRTERSLFASDQTLSATHDIYENIKTDVAIGPVYIVESQWQPTPNLTQAGGLTVFGEFRDHSLEKRESGPTTAARGRISSLLQQHLRYFEQHFPTKSSAGQGLPPALSDTVDLGERLGAQSTTGDNVDLIYSVPSYGADEKFVGIVSAMIDADAVRKELKEPYFVLCHPDAHEYVAGIDARAAIGKGWNDVCEGEIPDGYPYTATKQCKIVSGLPWLITAAVPSAVFFNTPDFVVTRGHGRTVMLGGLGLTGTLTAVVFLLMTSRARALKQAQSMTQSLLEAKDVAESANRAKSDFLARMSHEIRTPLNGVVGMIDLLGGTSMSDVQQRYSRLAKDAAGELILVINDILDFSKIEAGKVELESVDFDLHSLVEDLAELFTPLAAQKKLAVAPVIALDVPHDVIGDPGRIRQVLSNLINNAIKFTASGYVSIGVTVLRQESNAVVMRFAVEDTGIGISPTGIKRLFQSFSQVDTSTTRKFGGTGLGLAICKRLVELMGGEIGVDSHEGRGTSFWFTARLPLAAPAETDLSCVPAGELRAVRCLTVEKDAAFQTILSKQLSGWLASDSLTIEPEHALRAMQQAAEQRNPFDVLLVPLADAQAGLAAAIQADPRLQETVLIALVNIDDRYDVDSAKRDGFFTRLHRPLTQSRLIDAITSATVRPLAATAEIKPSAAIVPAAEALKGLHLLVAEDNEMNQFVTGETLKRAGCTFEIVADGMLAVAAARSGKFDAILMDCQMPGMDGWEASRQIRQEEALNKSRRVPIVALTAEAIQGDRARCLAAGMDGYVSKPISAAALYQEIWKTIGESTSPLPSNPAMAAVTRDESISNLMAAAPLQSSCPSPLDLKDLLARCMGDADFARVTLEKFRAVATEDVLRLAAVIQTNDVGETRRLSHNLKAVAAHVGAVGMRKAAFQIEQAAFQGEMNFVQQSLSKLNEEAQACAQYVPSAIAELAQMGPRQLVECGDKPCKY